MAYQQLKGTGVALITPFQKNGSIDYPALEKLVTNVIKGGVDFLVALGTTAETPTLTAEEKQAILSAIVKYGDGKVPVVCGIGGNNTDEVVHQLKKMNLQGVDGILSVAPYYNKPTQEGMYQHFKAIAEAVNLPIILYNVPGRSVADMSNETVLRLAQIPNIVGLKDATGNIGRVIELLNLAPKSFAVYSGDDPTAMALMLCGGQGNISVTANVAPRAMHDLCVAAMNGDVAKAIAINNRLIPLHSKLFVEPNPVPVKWAMAEMNLMPAGIRLPLVALAGEYHETVRAALRDSGIVLPVTSS